MRSQITQQFRRLFADLPERIQEGARQTYRLWTHDPRHPGLQFKKVHPTRPIYSVRIGLGWRAIGLLEGDLVVWFWIGPHAKYDALLKRL